MYQKLKQHKNNYFNSTSTTDAVPLKEIRKELLCPTDQDNKDSTQMLEDLGFLAIIFCVKELLDPNKATYSFMS